MDFDKAGFIKQMQEEEKSPVTIEKYVRDTGAFMKYTGDAGISKESVMNWKKHLIGEDYRPASINSMLASLNHYLLYIGKADCRTRQLRVQKNVFRSSDEELTREEYFKLIAACGTDERLRLIIQVLGSTGIRISELKYFTPESVGEGTVSIACKNKIRTVFIPKLLKDRLTDYTERKGIIAGCIFCTSSGRALNRSNVWTAMKKTAAKGGVDPQKVYPHNFRKLFAREYYSAYKDIAGLSDILGHSSIDTTKIYIMTSGAEIKKQIENLDLIHEPAKNRLTT